MPPKAKITRDMILHTVLELTREAGFDAVNARSIAEKLQCSTRPVFTCYESMDALKREFLAFAYEYYRQYVAAWQDAAPAAPTLVLPLSYIEFAREEPRLFRLLFVHDMDLHMTEAADFYREPDNETRVRAFSAAAGIGLEQARGIFLDLFLYAHGIAVLTAEKKLTLDRSRAEGMVSNVLSALLNQVDAAGKTGGA